ncbi:MAG TPA: hypothetical protein VNX68_10935, partial [Nitrosopumilaceae archaeon]|nr:hypothetical protein [Nitrosopumilaceae archaeon]
MKKNYTIFPIAISFALIFLSNFNLNAQAFRKGSLSLNLTEGSTYSTYSTYNMRGTKPELVNQCYIHGVRDPLSLEFGLSNRWGIGFSLGNDIFKVNPVSFYNLRTSTPTVKAYTTEVTIDAAYHFLVTNKADISVYGSLGHSGIMIKNSDKESPYQYSAGGGMIRLGVKARYYFYNRLGIT